MKENDSFYNASKYYLVDTEAGKLKASSISIKRKDINIIREYLTYEMASKKRQTDINGEEVLVPIESLVFLKRTDETYKDDLDIINYEVAHLLGIRALPAFHIIAVSEEEKKTGSILVSPYTKDDYFMYIDLLTKKMIKGGLVKIPEWLADFSKIPESSLKSPLMDSKLIKIIIDFPINVISLVFNLDSKALYKIKSAYINNILVSFITNQARIGIDTTGVVTNKGLSNVSLIPFYSYNNSLDIPRVINLSGKYVDANALVNTLFSEYYPFFKDMARGLNENLSAYKKSIELIVSNNTSKKVSKIILKNIFNKLDIVTSLEEETRLNHGESRIDMVCTQTSINLNAVNRNQEVRDKYEKVAPEMLEEIKEEEMVKVLEEKTKEEDDPTKKIRNVVRIILFLIVVAVIFLIVYYFKYRAM